MDEQQKQFDREKFRKKAASYSRTEPNRVETDSSTLEKTKQALCFLKEKQQKGELRQFLAEGRTDSNKEIGATGRVTRGTA